MELIPVALNGAYIEVHPATLAQHKSLGWRECEKQEPADASEEIEGDAPTKRGRKVAKPAEAGETAGE